ncbi:MAG: efflux RND transporter periplasmic adaptor subunit [Bacteroidales bacterium]
MKTHHIIIILLIIPLLVGCFQSSPKSTDEHAHDEHLQRTAYNADFELFAKFEPLVLDKESHILLQITHLNNFKPLTEGKITASLIVGEHSVSQTLEEPFQAGTFEFTLSPQTIGLGKLVFEIMTPSGSAQITLDDIQVYDDEHEAQHEAEEESITSANGVIITKEQSWKIDFATEIVKSQAFGQIIRATAQVQPSQMDEKVIVAKASGMVQFVKSDVLIGQSVHLGESLFIIEGGGLADNNIDVRYNEALSEYNRAKSDYERKKELAKDRIVSERALFESEATFKNAEIVYNNLRQNFSSGKQIIKSPVNGFIKQVLVKNGEYAPAGQAIFIVTSNKNLIITAHLSQRYAPMLSQITGANLRIMNTNKVYSLNELGGKIISYGRSTNLNNPLIPVSFSIQNTADFIAGSFVEIHIITRTNSNAIVVPNGAIVEEMGAFFVFVQITPEYFEKRLITTGVSDGLNTEVIKGVNSGERVVTKGAILLKLLQSANSLDAEHGHVH